MSENRLALNHPYKTFSEAFDVLVDFNVFEGLKRDEQSDAEDNFNFVEVVTTITPDMREEAWCMLFQTKRNKPPLSQKASLASLITEVLCL